jgi:tetratricopeptide (TPR) repeat protein
MTKGGSQRSATIESLKDRIAHDPFSRAFLQLAEEYRKEGRFQEAIQVCLEGLQRHPTYHTARIALGRTYLDGGDMENARRSFVEVLELQPENHLAGKLLAEIQKKMGDPAGAAATYRGILRYYPGDREVGILLDELLRQVAPPPAVPEPIAAEPATAAAVPAPAAASPGPPHGTRERPVDPFPDLRPEDLGGLGETPEEDDALQTNTLAELYLRQGLIERAIEVYRGMLRVDPGNGKAARRLNELTTGFAAPRPDTKPVPRIASLPEVVPAPAPAPALPAREDTDARRSTIRRLERWLANFSGPAAKGAPL